MQGKALIGAVMGAVVLAGCTMGAGTAPVSVGAAVDPATDYACRREVALASGLRTDRLTLTGTAANGVTPVVYYSHGAQQHACYLDARGVAIGAARLR